MRVKHTKFQNWTYSQRSDLETNQKVLTEYA